MILIAELFTKKNSGEIGTSGSDSRRFPEERVTLSGD